jgi:hypothetical protein
MSWDIFIFSQDPRHLAKGAKPAPLGDAAEVRAKISKSLPDVNWKDPAWGVLEGKGWSIEFNHQTNGVAAANRCPPSASFARRTVGWRWTARRAS